MSYSIKFGKPKQVKTESGKSFCTIPILKEDLDGSCVKLTFLTDKCFSWGVQEEKGDDKRVKGHKLLILVISIDEQGVLKAMEKQNEFLELWTNLVAMAKKFCMQNVESVVSLDLTHWS